MKKSTILALAAFMALILVSAAVARQQNDEKVVCPVTGETMLKSQAKATYVYEGKTYYFCCESCKAKFIADPAKYTAKTPETKTVYTCPMHPEVQSDEPGQCPKCGMNLVKKQVPVGGTSMAMGQSAMAAGDATCSADSDTCTMAADEGGSCPMTDMMGLAGAVLVTENLKDGVSFKITSDNPDTVKKLQEMAAKFAAAHK